jgi:hypothetical protein
MKPASLTIISSVALNMVIDLRIFGNFHNIVAFHMIVFAMFFSRYLAVVRHWDGRVVPVLLAPLDGLGRRGQHGRLGGRVMVVML